MKEVWKDIKGYEGLYQVSNLGRIKSLPRKRTIKTERILSPKFNKGGYLEVALCKNSKYKMCRVHRLVASAFIQNPENKREVNHIDGNKLNNKADNLEWVTPSENIRHAFKTGLIQLSELQKNRLGDLNRGNPSKNRKKVFQYDLHGNLIKEWYCISDVEKTLKIRTQNICACLKNKQKQAGGYIWKYADTE